MISILGHRSPSLLKQIIINFDTFYVTINLVNIVFSFSTRKEDFKQFAFTQNGQCYKFRVLFLSYVNSPSFRHNIVQRYLEHLDIPQKITLIYTHDIMLIGPDKQELARTLEALGRHTYIPFHRMIQRPNTSVESVVAQ